MNAYLTGLLGKVRGGLFKMSRSSVTRRNSAWRRLISASAAVSAADCGASSATRRGCAGKHPVALPPRNRMAALDHLPNRLLPELLGKTNLYHDDLHCSRILRQQSVQGNRGGSDCRSGTPQRSGGARRASAMDGASQSRRRPISAAHSSFIMSSVDCSVASAGWFGYTRNVIACW